MFPIIRSCKDRTSCLRSRCYALLSWHNIWTLSRRLHLARSDDWKYAARQPPAGLDAAPQERQQGQPTTQLEIAASAATLKSSAATGWQCQTDTLLFIVRSGKYAGEVRGSMIECSRWSPHSTARWTQAVCGGMLLLGTCLPALVIPSAK